MNFERRRAPRAPVHVPIQLAPNGAGQSAELVNLSTSGLCCHFSAAISEMTLVAIELDLPGARGTKVQGAVVRCEKLRGINPPTYEVGVFFTDMSDATRKLLGEFVDQQLVRNVAQ
ncbi:MAG: PilZ domain-containing protein [Planctomycetes bacterium]|nr:PilZ domain-containing protein [Planctomycetota bacterium]MCB9888919.1 PilZ domain-containing protein [Planctomycetota bacterium]